MSGSKDKCNRSLFKYQAFYFEENIKNKEKHPFTI